jgi:hypothetical protein
MSKPKVHSCISCHEKSADLIRWNFKNYSHLECGLSKWGQAFLNHLTVEQLEAISEELLREKNLYDYWRALLARKQQYANRLDLVAGRHSVRAI